MSCGATQVATKACRVIPNMTLTAKDRKAKD